MKNPVVLIGLAFLLTGCNPEAESTDPTAKDAGAEQEETIDSLQNEVERLKQKVTDVEKTAEKAVDIMDEEQLHQLAEAQWHYQLQINEQSIEEVDDQSNISVDGDSLEVRLVETQCEYSPLPNEVHNQGKLDDFHEGIEVTPDSYEKSAPAGGTINSVIYRFDEEDFPSQPVEIHIDEPLQERLDLASGNITITGP